MSPPRDSFEEQFSILAHLADAVGRATARRQLGSYISDDLGFRQWTTSVQSLLRRVFGSDSEYYGSFSELLGTIKHTPYVREFLRLKGIFLAANEDFTRGWTSTLESLVAADVFADFLEMANYLLQEHYKDPAAVLVGGVLEEHLRRLCQHNSIPIARTDSRGRTVPAKADAMNAELARQRVYHKLDQKSVTAWLDLRNKAAHGDYDAYNEEQVRNMLEGVREFAKRTLP